MFDLHYQSVAAVVHHGAYSLVLYFAPFHWVDKAIHKTPQNPLRLVQRCFLLPRCLVARIACCFAGLEERERQKGIKAPLEPFVIIKKGTKERDIWLAVNESYKMEMGNMCKHFKYFAPARYLKTSLVKQIGNKIKPGFSQSAHNHFHVNFYLVNPKIY